MSSPVFRLPFWPVCSRCAALCTAACGLRGPDLRSHRPPLTHTYAARATASVLACKKEGVCMCVWTCRVNTKHPFLFPQPLSFLTVCVCLCLIISFHILLRGQRGLQLSLWQPQCYCQSPRLPFPPWFIFYTCGLLSFDRCAGGMSHNCIAHINKCRTDINRVHVVRL